MCLLPHIPLPFSPLCWTFALFCAVCFGKAGEWELTHWPLLLGFSACFCCDLWFQMARSEVLLEYSHQPPLYPHNSSFKLFFTCGAMGVSSRVASGITGLGSRRTWVRCEGRLIAKKAGLGMGTLGLSLPNYDT